VLRKRLLAVPGVAEVLPIGGDLQQFQVTLKPERLAAYGLTIDEVVKAVEGANQNAAAGFYAENGQEYLIQGIGRVRTVEDIAEAVVAMKHGQPVLIRHVADVALGTRIGARRRLDQRQARRGARHPAPAGGQHAGADARLDATMADIQKSLPAGMKIENAAVPPGRLHRNLDRQPDGRAARRGDPDRRHRLRLPALGALDGDHAGGAAAVAGCHRSGDEGARRDDQHHDAGRHRHRPRRAGRRRHHRGREHRAALRENHAKPEAQRESTMHVVFLATKEIQGSIVFATLIIMLVFVPLFFLSGVEGRLMVPLGLAYVISCSPRCWCRSPLRRCWPRYSSGNSKEVASTANRASSSGCARYRRLLDATLERWQAIAAASGALLVAALIGLGMAGQSFLPDFNEGTLTVGVETFPAPPGRIGPKLGQMVEEVLLTIPKSSPPRGAPGVRRSIRTRSTCISRKSRSA
jgi:Cu/Ag efflux pump CusA